MSFYREKGNRHVVWREASSTATQVTLQIVESTFSDRVGQSETYERAVFKARFEPVPEKESGAEPNRPLVVTPNPEQLHDNGIVAHAPGSMTTQGGN